MLSPWSRDDWEPGRGGGAPDLDAIGDLVGMLRPKNRNIYCKKIWPVKDFQMPFNVFSNNFASLHFCIITFGCKRPIVSLDLENSSESG